MKITVELLREKKADAEWIRWFEELFPDGTDFTDEDVEKAKGCPQEFVWWLFDAVGLPEDIVNRLCGNRQTYGLYKSNDNDWSEGLYKSNDNDWSDGLYKSNDNSESNGLYGSTGNSKSNGLYWSTGNSNSGGLYRSTGNSNSHGLYRSTGNSNSHALYGSNDNDWSDGLYRSNDNDWSDGLYKSNDNDWSSGLYKSNGNHKSNGLYGSTGNSKSNGLYGSTGDSDSDGLYESNDNSKSNGLYGSTGNYNSRGLSHCFWTRNVEGACKALFLDGKDVVPTIFGVPVSDERFHEVKARIFELLGEWRPRPQAVDGGEDSRLSWEEMPQEAIDYIVSLREFNAEKFENITGINVDVKTNAELGQESQDLGDEIEQPRNELAVLKENKDE